MSEEIDIRTVSVECLKFRDNEGEIIGIKDCSGMVSDLNIEVIYISSQDGHSYSCYRTKYGTCSMKVYQRYDVIVDLKKMADLEMEKILTTA